VLERRKLDLPWGWRRTENLLRAGEAWSWTGVLGSGEMLAWRDCERGVKAREVASGERAALGGDAGCEYAMKRGEGAGEGDTECWPFIGEAASAWR
jgi:hypothetical protein